MNNHIKLLRSFSFAMLLLLLVAGTLNAQVSHQNGRPTGNRAVAPSGITSFIMEDFEGGQFPPPGWTLEYTRSSYWELYKGVSAYGVGSASALFDIWDPPSGTTQSLVLSSMGATVSGDSLRFDHAYASYSGENDQLILETSTNGGASYSMLATLDGGTSGPLVTAPPQMTKFIPTSTQWATKQYPLPIGTNRVRFTAVSAFGNNLYLDNCTVGTRVAIDAGTESFDIPNPTLTLPQIPKATVQNHGPTTETFTVTMLISPGGYTSTRTVTALASNATSQISFDVWIPTVGSYNVSTFTSLAGDQDNTNDTLRLAVVANQALSPVTNINAFFRDGQVFVTWSSLTTTNVVYTLYRSSNPISYGYQLLSAQNLGNVRDNSSLNQRLTNIAGGTPVYLKIDSASPPLSSDKGLFVATSTTAGSFYYAITPTINGLEDTTIVVGSNSLASPESETVIMPKPVWQEDTIVRGKTFNIYVQFATKVTSSIYPQMTNAGSYPFNFAIAKAGAVSPHPVTFWMHPTCGTFLGSCTGVQGIGDPNEWIVTIDDYIPNIDHYTFYYGFHEGYDVHSDANPVPNSGILYNYTAARVAHTVNWAIRNLPVDSTRTYMTGWSMGAIGSLLNSIMNREKIAAIFIYCPRVDNSTWWEPRLWGTYDANLLTNEGYRRNDRLNANYLVSANPLNSLPLMFIFCGKNDVNVGWQEKIAFYESMNANKHGAFQFWSMTDHQSTFYSSPWQPSFPNFSFFTRYRTNLSYPAFSNCSINNKPGDGNPSHGDGIGSINGHLDWNDNIVDTTNRWEITLKLKDLSTIYGSDIAPDSAMTDVTLRRLQAFSVPPQSMINWENRRNNIIVQHGSFAYDSGLVTILDVIVYKDSSRLTVSWFPVSGVEISGMTFNDRNGNGRWDRNEPGISGSKIRLTGTKNDSTLTDANGAYTFEGVPIGTYTVSEELPPGWVQSMPDSPKTYSVDITTGGNISNKNFGNMRLSLIRGQVFADTNQNGIKDSSEIGIFGVHIHLSGAGSSEAYSDSNGYYGLSGLTPGIYYVSEDVYSPCIQTFPAPPGRHMVVIPGDTTVNGLDFGIYGDCPHTVITCPLHHGWIILSLPVCGGSYLKSSLFPVATSPAFAYENGYVIKDTLVNGAGYWLKFAAPETVQMTGMLCLSDTFDVVAGWNLVGSTTDTVMVNSIATVPPGMISSSFFGYEGRYTEVNALCPGKGYWVKVNQSGKLILSLPGSLNAAARIRIVPGGELPPDPPNDNELLGVIPKTYALEQNYPNPFNPTTTLNYQLPTQSYVRLKIFDVLGREVVTLVNGEQTAGFKSVTWNATNVPSGVYFYRLSAEAFSETKKLLLIK